MYSHLFNAATDAVNILQHSPPTTMDVLKNVQIHALEILKEAQIKTEQMYIDAGDAEEEP
jgi:UPF0288 family protein (methanogenesis marker protein 3)